MNEKDRLEVQALIERRSIPEPNSGCWLWDAAVDLKGYGRTKWKGCQQRAHRLSFQAFTAVDPTGGSVMHSCDVSSCVNPTHLMLGTPADNSRDMRLKGRALGRGGKCFRVAPGGRSTHSFMPVKGMQVTAEALCRIVSYDPMTGEFRWLERRDDHGWSRKNAGKIAGSIGPHGKPDRKVLYRRISVFGKDHYAHRLAWLYVHGEWPAAHEIDHINGDTLDNRIANLRRATHAQNGANTGLRRNNRSGVKGVSWDTKRGRWFASITIGGKAKALGRFDDFDDAVAARRIAEAEHHGSFAHTKGTC